MSHSAAEEREVVSSLSHDDALIELCCKHINRSHSGGTCWRGRGVDCSSNVTTALLFFGDCREHAMVMLAFHDYWQLQHVNARLRAAHQHQLAALAA